MATAIAHVHAESKSSPGTTYEVSVWRLGNNNLVTSCTCPAALYQPRTICKHRDAIETQLRRYGHTRLPSGQLQPPTPATKEP